MKDTMLYASPTEVKLALAVSTIQYFLQNTEVIWSDLQEITGALKLKALHETE